MKAVWKSAADARAGSRFVRTSSEFLSKGGTHYLQIENRLATPEEQETLAKYVGWGGLSMAFDGNNAAWANEYK